MNIKRIPMARLREILAATESAAAGESVSVRILRREFERRQRCQTRKAVPTVPRAPAEASSAIAKEVGDAH